MVKDASSGAFGARVLSVMCCALTDGFGPGTAAPSGLVQRGVIMPPVGGSRGAAIKLIARQGDTTPSEPFEPSELSEPGPQSGPMSDTTTLGPKGRRPLYTTCRRKAATTLCPKGKTPGGFAAIEPSRPQACKKRLAIYGFPVYNKGHNKTQGKRACVLWYAGLFYFGGGCDDSALWGRINKRER